MTPAATLRPRSGHAANGDASRGRTRAMCVLTLPSPLSTCGCRPTASPTPPSMCLPQVRKCPRMMEPNGDCSSTSTVNPEPNTLFEAIKSAKVAVETVVVDWLETYKRDRETGFLELINFIVCSCGVVTPQMFRDLQNSEIIQRLTEQFKEDSSEYPFSLNTRPWRRFRAGFCELLTAVVQRCQYSIIYDEFLMGSLISFLISLTDSQVRAFRHTSTLAGRQHPWVAPLRHPWQGSRHLRALWL
uniref:STAG domain-containing protein n=1 Tax=Amazona collaria TaxID=241587 RepID=A0A8B9GIM4_9PSIT